MGNLFCGVQHLNTILTPVLKGLTICACLSISPTGEQTGGASRANLWRPSTQFSQGARSTAEPDTTVGDKENKRGSQTSGSREQNASAFIEITGKFQCCARTCVSVSVRLELEGYFPQHTELSLKYLLIKTICILCLVKHEQAQVYFNRL